MEQQRGGGPGVTDGHGEAHTSSHDRALGPADEQLQP